MKNTILSTKNDGQDDVIMGTHDSSSVLPAVDYHHQERRRRRLRQERKIMQQLGFKRPLPRPESDDDSEKDSASSSSSSSVEESSSSSRSHPVSTRNNGQMICCCWRPKTTLPLQLDLLLVGDGSPDTQHLATALLQVTPSSSSTTGRNASRNLDTGLHQSSIDSLKRILESNPCSNAINGQRVNHIVHIINRLEQHENQESLQARYPNVDHIVFLRRIRTVEYVQHQRQGNSGGLASMFLADGSWPDIHPRDCCLQRLTMVAVLTEQFDVAGSTMMATVADSIGNDTNTCSVPFSVLVLVCHGNQVQSYQTVARMLWKRAALGSRMAASPVSPLVPACHVNASK